VNLQLIKPYKQAHTAKKQTVNC